MRMRLKDNHPLTEKFYALMEKAEELGIYLEVVGETMGGSTPLLVSMKCF